jgi:hypothetical protein
MLQNGTCTHLVGFPVPSRLPSWSHRIASNKRLTHMIPSALPSSLLISSANLQVQSCMLFLSLSLLLSLPGSATVCPLGPVPERDATVRQSAKTSSASMTSTKPTAQHKFLAQHLLWRPNPTTPKPDTGDSELDEQRQKSESLEDRMAREKLEISLSQR